MKAVRTVKTLAILTSLLAWLFTYTTALAQPPTQEDLQRGLRGVTGKKIEVLEITESGIPGFYQVVISLEGRKRIIYTDSTGSYFFLGQIIEVKTGRNLTREAFEEVNRLTKDDIKKLDSLTAFTIGKGDKTLYFVTDPQCPYCKRAQKDLERLSATKDVTVKFLLFPLGFHKGAKEQCISLICDKKGLRELESGYRSDDQCEEGRKKVEETINFLTQKGVWGTPTYIFANGLRHSGLMSEEQLCKMMGITSDDRNEPMMEDTHTSSKERFGETSEGIKHPDLAGRTPVGGPCVYTSYPGTATIVSITKSKSEPHLTPYQGYEVTFTFRPKPYAGEIPSGIEGKKFLLRLKNSWLPGPKFIEKYKIEEGKSFDCVLKVIKSGTCTPFLFEFPGIDLTDYFERNPSSS